MMLVRTLLSYAILSCCLLASTVIAGGINNIQPQSLSEIMLVLLAESEQVKTSILDENYVVMQLAAQNIVQYSKAPTNVMVKLVEKFGVNVMHYKDLETNMYYQAKSLLKAVKQKNNQQVLLLYRQMLQQCHDCHAVFQ